MLAKLKMKLETDSLDYRKASCMQGVLFENIDPEYVDELHAQNMHPYSQYLEKTDNGTFWNICTLNEEAFQRMILPVMSSMNAVALKGNETEVAVLEKTLITIADEALMKEVTVETPEKLSSIDFITPTAFKQGGRYVILPDVRLLLQNLMMKYTTITNQIEAIDPETLDGIAESCFVTSHRIRSLRFPMEKVFTPGFVGRVVLRCDGAGTIAGYVRLLLKYGEFSGTGVKTGMGMGAIRLVEERKHDE